jgi:phosphatidylglycerol:prolipoprotein diacylglycerol transferase
MITWLHTFNPQATLISLGPINIYWYGLFIVLGIGVALLVSLKIATHYKISRDLIFDFSFWLIINGLIGARLYEVFLELPYYLSSPLSIFKVWEGGLAIHGGIIAGLLTLYFLAKKHQLNFWLVTALFTPGLALGQAIGRFGNYFNQELFGRPTNLPWGIPIEVLNRPPAYIEFTFFHPTFLYESLGLIIIFIVLMGLTTTIITSNSINLHTGILISAVYMILYSLLRFELEFIKIDQTPLLLGLRWPQIISLIIIIIFSSLLIFHHHDQKTNA